MHFYFTFLANAIFKNLLYILFDFHQELEYGYQRAIPILNAILLLL